VVNYGYLPGQIWENCLMLIILLKLNCKINVEMSSWLEVVYPEKERKKYEGYGISILWGKKFIVTNKLNMGYCSGVSPWNVFDFHKYMLFGSPIKMLKIKDLTH